MSSRRSRGEKRAGSAGAGCGRAASRRWRSSHHRWLVNHVEFRTGAGEREDAVRQPPWPYDDQLNSRGPRALIGSEDRSQARNVQEAKTTQVKDDSPRGWSFEDAVESVFDVPDACDVELAAQAQV
jgi:hypothetical protein